MTPRTARRPARAFGVLGICLLLTAIGIVAAPLSASAATTRTVTTSVDTVTPGSFRQAVADSVPGDTIVFDPAVTSIVLSSPVVLPVGVTIDGGDTVTLSAGAAIPDALLTVAPGSPDQDYTITRIGLVGAVAAASRGILVGGGVDPARDVTISHAALGGFRQDVGSAIDVTGLNGILTLDDSTVESNLATGAGGSALAISAPAVTSIAVTNTTIGGNITASGTDSDGAVSIVGTGAAPISFTGDQIESNVVGVGSTVLGAGLSLGSDGNPIGAVTISGSTFDDNGDTGAPGRVAPDAGGAAYVGNAASVTVSASTFHDNTASSAGGGLLLDTVTGAVHLDRDTFDSNSATGGTVPIGGSGPSGGALFAGGVQGAFTATGLVLENNSADDKGGGMMLVELSSGFSVDTSTFTGNVAATGAGIFTLELHRGQEATVTDSTFSGNVADGDFGAGGAGGAGLFVELIDAGSSLTVQASTFTANSYSPATPGCGCTPPGLSVYVFQAAGEVGIAESTFDETSSVAAATPIQVDALTRSGTFALTNSTVVGDLGADFGLLRGAARVSHSIVQVPSGTDALTVDSVGGGQALDVQWSLLSSGLGPNETDTVGDQLTTDAQLATLANNGGPTQTMLPQTGSPAIDAGDPAFSDPVTVDQRGLTRIVRTIDIGAVEVQATTPASLPPTGVPIGGGVGAAFLLMLLGGIALNVRIRSRRGRLS